MFNSLLKNLSILKKFLFINFVFFTIIGTFIFIYLKNVQPNLIKNKSSNHIKIINNTINNLDRLEIKFNENDIRKFLFSTRFDLIVDKSINFIKAYLVFLNWLIFFVTFLLILLMRSFE